MNAYFDNFQVATTTGPVLEENNYYPFGMINGGLSNPGTNSPLNNYKYNGKELQNELNLVWLDYGARFYDPQIKRWHCLDPKVEKYYSLSPYNYADNNSVKNIDMYGKDIFDINGNLLKSDNTNIIRIQTKGGLVNLSAFKMNNMVEAKSLTNKYLI